ncbi:4-coumarate--CoA ligase family protein [Kitasatospora sp. A2-31]|uniref:4-coumarate--CoA ligase family protein n=1 Tax=Kitasatospora sp. A2-31 TaxID=2916414 RepID=UPI001EEC21E2|nr:4-coumarate--CoA ligase family protein [Kitasatospora sp. A2-31]MCG6498492.1 4-coumarate--CoA ligase family protein [Kitasatospora sp. A2-31]
MIRQLPARRHALVFHSEFPDVAVVDLPIHEAVLGGADRFGDRPALVDGVTGESVSYARLGAAVRRVAAGLAEAGVRRGDVLALFSPNTIGYPMAFYGATRAGATVTTVSSLATAGELAGQLADSGARWLVTVSPFLATARQAAEKLAAEGTPLAEIIVLDGAEGHRSLADLLAASGPEPEPDLDPGTDIAVLPYSSGTTGLPKGVMLTHRSIATNLAQTDALYRPAVGERVLAVLPFFHIYGLAALLNQPLRCGATVVVLPRFDLEQFCRTIEEQRVQALIVAPPIALALAKHPVVDRFDLSSLEYLLCAAAPLDHELAEACARRLGLPRILQGYGMTELSPVTHVVSPDETDPSPGSVGRLVPSTELRVVALDGTGAGAGADLGPGERGELLIRGPQVMKGYFGRPSDTAATIDADGWLHTGDVGYVDERGYLFIVDRVKELIKYKGYQVAPAELEALLLGHPGIADAAVIGVADADGTERPKAFVVRAPGSTLTEEEVTAFVAGQVAPYKKVRAVEFLDAVPKSAAGKILRRELRAREAGR